VLQDEAYDVTSFLVGQKENNANRSIRKFYCKIGEDLFFTRIIN